MGRGARGFFFGGAENEICGRVLEFPERRPVDCVDDNWHTRAFRRETAKDSGLAAVGVNDVRFLFAKKVFQFPQREKIFQRMNRADEFGNNFEQRGDF